MEKVIIKRPNESPIVTEVEKIDLAYLQSVVDGWIESVYIPQFDDIADEISCFCNEEGKLNGLDFNFPLVMSNGQTYDTIVGTAVFCGCDTDGNSIGLTDEQVSRVLNYLANPTVYPKIVFNVGFVNLDEEDDEAQLDAEGGNDDEIYADLMNLIKSLWNELNIKKITYIERKI